MTYVEEDYGPDEWLVGVHPGETSESLQNRVKGKYDKTVKPEVQPLDFMVGLKVSAPKWDRVVAEAIDGKGKAVSFSLVLDKSELRLQAGLPTGTQFKLGAVKVPSELEPYRLFLVNLGNWSGSGGAIVSEATMKAWTAKNPQAPAKPAVYKTFAEMLQKDKPAADAFRAWAKKNSAGQKVLKDLEATDKAKAADPARAKALKAADGLLPAFYKSF